jgi:signal transduction histidine kinase
VRQAIRGPILAVMTGRVRRSPGGLLARRVRRVLTALGSAAGVCVLAVQAVLLAVLLVVVVASVAWTVFVPSTLLWVRWLAGRARTVASRSGGPTIAAGYRPAPAPARGVEGWMRRAGWVLTDPATWRDLRWLLAAPVVGLGLAGPPVAAVGYGLYSIAVAVTPVPGGPLRVDGAWTGLLGAALVAAGLLTAPAAVRLHARATRRLLAPSRVAALQRRVDQLAQTRADALDAQAAELRRIERDLHDGAQVRLALVTMTLSAVDRLMDDDPPAARALLTEARDATATALGDLRDLVRGVHPPVLADRGLGDAVQALALDTDRRITVTVDLPGRPAPAIESAAYFAVAEALANAIKHADATRVVVDIRYTGGRLRVTVTDDGHGGADPTGGSGLLGIGRRLASFDGTLAVRSPQGGPTTVTMEVPCGLHSPRTTHCSATD